MKMKKLMLCCLLVVVWIVSGCGEKEEVQDNPLLTREEIVKLAPPFVLDNGTEYDGSRLYAEIGLTLNGLEDIIISEALYTGGNGGIMWNLYICVGTNQYRGPVAEIGGRTLAVEGHYYGEKRIWAFWASSGSSGNIAYLYCYDGKWSVSPSWEIYTGTFSETGSGIMEAIFNEHTRLPMRKIFPASPTSDLPYVDEPWGW